MFVDMATSNPQVFVEHIETLKQLGEKQPGNMVQIIQIIGAIGTINEVSVILCFVFSVSE